MRKHRELLINLVTLMIDSGIENLPREDAPRILFEMNERFLPNLDDSKAGIVFEQILQESLKCATAEIFEEIHRIKVLGLKGAYDTRK